MLIRDTIRRERKLHIDYSIWRGSAANAYCGPCAGLFDQLRCWVSWCELRQAFRHFASIAFRPPCRWNSAIARPAAAAEKNGASAGALRTIAARCWHKLSVARFGLCYRGTGRFPSPRGQTIDSSQHDPALRRQPAEQRCLLSTLTGTGTVELSPGFALFVLNNGFKLGMWAKQGVKPAATLTGGGGELGFCARIRKRSRRAITSGANSGCRLSKRRPRWRSVTPSWRGIPDGHRLRVYALSE